MQYALIIVGPTGVGKTDLAQKIIMHDPSKFVMINADLGQFYKPLNIGTAKPLDLPSSIETHFFDIIAEPKNWNIEDFRKQMGEKLKCLWRDNKIPVIVGGSGFYIRSLFYCGASADTTKSQVNILPEDPTVVMPLSWDLLNQIDPERAKKIPKNDLYRIKRALDIYKLTGKKASEFSSGEFKPLFKNFDLINCIRSKEELYSIINQRVYHMMQSGPKHSGWVEEVKNLDDAWHNFLFEKKIIGYSEIINNKFEIDDNLIKSIQQRTRNYAKRQMTYFRYLQKNIFGNSSACDLDLNSNSVNLYIDQLLKKLVG